MSAKAVLKVKPMLNDTEVIASPSPKAITADAIWPTPSVVMVTTALRIINPAAFGLAETTTACGLVPSLWATLIVLEVVACTCACDTDPSWKLGRTARVPLFVITAPLVPIVREPEVDNVPGIVTFVGADKLPELSMKRGLVVLAGGAAGSVKV